ncbi:hypothetical protein K6L09_46130, partial [Burkholderia cepacia]
CNTRRKHRSVRCAALFVDRADVCPHAFRDRVDCGNVRTGRIAACTGSWQGNGGGPSGTAVGRRSTRDARRHTVDSPDDAVRCGTGDRPFGSAEIARGSTVCRSFAR